jgi:hypothetical protein
VDLLRKTQIPCVNVGRVVFCRAVSCRVSCRARQAVVFCRVLSCCVVFPGVSEKDALFKGKGLTIDSGID